MSSKKMKNSKQKSRSRQTSSKKSRKKSKSDSSQKAKLLSIEKVKITEYNTDRYMSSNRLDVQPKIWELPNRKTYYNWIFDVFKDYKVGNKLKPGKGSVELFRIQRLVKNFFQEENPNRGILLYHGLGLGKSGAAISIAEAIPNRDVVFLSKASLETNFIFEIKKFGGDYMRTSNYWVFSTCKSKYERDLAQSYKIPLATIDKNEGCFFIDFKTSKKPNYLKMTPVYRDKLDKQISATIHKRFTFLHLDDTRLLTKINEGDLNNKVVIVDEVHNLINSMTSETVTGAFFYKFMMNVKDSKFVFLSGTPLINKVFEASKMYNILKGYIPTLIYRIITTPFSDINWSEIKTQLLENFHIDQIVIDKTRKTIKVTKLPDNYINIKKDNLGKNNLLKQKSKSSSKSSSKFNNSKSKNKINNRWDGIIYSPEQNATFEEFRDQIDKTVKSLSKSQKFNLKFNFENNTALPDIQLEFEKMFYNTEFNKLKNKEIIKKRINGLTSYYHKIVDKSEFPETKFIKTILVPMSDYQLGKYKELRTDEIIKEKRNKKKQDDKYKSSFRIYSRLLCTFSFPEEVGDPYDKEGLELLKNVENIENVKHLNSQKSMKHPKLSASMKKEMKSTLEAALKSEKEDDDELISKKDYLQTLKTNQDIVKEIMNNLNDMKEELLTGSSLEKYSPKFAQIIKNIKKSPGSCFLYSQFINVVGLKLFGMVLEAQGNYCPFRLVKVGAKYRLDKTMYERGIDVKDLNTYIIYAGDTTDKELKEIYRLIFNSDYENLPNSCNYLVKELDKLYGKERNKYGNIVKIFMTTRTGAEGISLYNVRQVHIMEPYWQPVLIDQVIGRALRMGSHKMLPLNERNVEVYVYMACFAQEQIKELSMTTLKKDIGPYNDGLNKKGKLITSDEFLYIISAHKKAIISEMNVLIMGSAFDCTLNYSDNIKKEKGISCIDYNTKDRDDYLYPPNIEDTIDEIEIQQEYVMKINYIKIAFPKGSTNYYYIAQNPPPGGKRYIYNEDILSKVGAAPIGEIGIKDGKKLFKLYKKKRSKSKSRSRSKSR